jgi:hypothetical protein
MPRVVLEEAAAIDGSSLAIRLRERRLWPTYQLSTIQSHELGRSRRQAHH